MKPTPLSTAIRVVKHLRPRPHAHPAVLQGITTDRVGRYFELVRVMREASK